MEIQYGFRHLDYSKMPFVRLEVSKPRALARFWGAMRQAGSSLINFAIVCLLALCFAASVTLFLNGDEIVSAIWRATE